MGSTPYAQSQLASVTARGGAWLVDIVASVAVAAVVSLAVGAVSDGLADLAFLLVWVGWYIGPEAVWGLTLGKWIVGIEVVGTDGEVVSAGAAVARNVTKIVGGASLLLILAGVVFIADSENNQRLGDQFADTLVVRV
ncbi:RDD domain-containing protein [Halorubrum californiense DSM 19288]|uniref:RDD domain-containing protein n=1 Tax=Halorubrum californiense DSM 19288 TaxID=1227465 RepID=M0EHF9_9EURY|nr:MULTISPECIES: RDD family protein [Halorubrum]ELZ45849.1 RDD domain-containing protein [Halorubrum californiense DSM 19288]TKX69643.1 RDD family protein [Halorubrum sp. GN11GM_10-3_MGM]